MEKEIYTLKLADFANLFGTSVDDISKDCQKLISKFDFRYYKLYKKEQDETILDVLKQIDSNQFTKTSKRDKERWETGWTENFKGFVEKNYNLNQLTPKYYFKRKPLRLFGKYIMPLDINFEINWYTVFRMWSFKKYLRDAGTIYEFGCGSGCNLPILAKLYPKKELHGLDWATVSRSIIKGMAKHYKWSMTGHFFDMRSPNENFKIKKNSAILTLGGLEQLGNHYKPFLEFILRKKPLICFHREPLIELYDPNVLVDYLALKYHKQRRYLGKFLSTLKKLESKNKIKIIKIKRIPFGSLNHEAYSFIVWQPI